MGRKHAISAPAPDGNADLRYLDASKVTSPCGNLASIDLRGSDDRQIGRVSGVLIDPAERRVRFFVVSASRAGHRNYVLPTDGPARIDTERNSLQLEVDPDDVPRYPEFRPSRTSEFSDDDLLTVLFADRNR